MKPLLILAEAEVEVTAAAHRYDQLAPDLGDAFLWRFEESLRRLRAYPEMYQVVFDDVRRASLRRFPHSVFYRLLPEEIEVVGVQHDHSDPATVIERLRGGE